MMLHQRLIIRYIWHSIAHSLYCINYWYCSVVYNIFCSQLMIFVSLSVEKIIIHALTVSTLSHLSSCTPTKSNLYLANSLATAVSDPNLYRFLTFHVPNLISLFHCLCRKYQRISPGPRQMNQFRNKTSFYCEDLLAFRRNSKLEDHPLYAVRDCFAIYSRLTSISEAVPPSTVWGRVKPWSQGPTYNGGTADLLHIKPSPARTFRYSSHVGVKDKRHTVNNLPPHSKNYSLSSCKKSIIYACNKIIYFTFPIRLPSVSH